MDKLQVDIHRLDRRYGHIRVRKEAEVRRLADSINRHGQLEALLTVTANENGLVLIDGDQRLKARVERPFDYVENNFLAGRVFTSWHDLNQQAREWCEQTANRKIKQGLGMSPQEAWILEKSALLPPPRVLPPVYVPEQRIVDIEGYIHLDTNRYSVPDTLIGQAVEVQKYWDEVVVYHGRNKVAVHGRELTGRDRRITTPGHHRPLTRQKAHHGPCPEVKLLTGHDLELDRYVAELQRRAPGRGLTRLRRLLELKRVYPAEPFMKAIREALAFGLYDLSRLEKMILKHTSGDFFEIK